jgi:hypothetical protein
MSSIPNWMESHKNSMVPVTTNQRFLMIWPIENCYVKISHWWSSENIPNYGCNLNFFYHQRKLSSQTSELRTNVQGSSHHAIIMLWQLIIQSSNVHRSPSGKN